MPPTDDILTYSLGVSMYPENGHMTGMSGSINMSVHKSLRVPFSKMGEFMQDMYAAWNALDEKYGVKKD